MREDKAYLPCEQHPQPRQPVPQCNDGLDVAKDQTPAAGSRPVVLKTFKEHEGHTVVKRRAVRERHAQFKSAISRECRRTVGLLNNEKTV